MKNENDHWNRPFDPYWNRPFDPYGASGDGFVYDIVQDDGGNRVTVNYNSSHDTKVVALVANAQGYVYKRAEQQCEAGSGQFTIDCAGLRRGQYIIYINTDGDRYTEKINLK